MARRRYLLDSNILSAVIREPDGIHGQRIMALAGDELCTSVVVACELRFGAVKRGSASLSKAVDRVLAHIDILPLEPEVDRHYAEIRASLEQRGLPIGHNDLFIAAHTRALDLILVTNNLSEFQRVPGLKVESWAAPTP